MKFWTQKEKPFRRMAVIVCLPDAIVSLTFVFNMLFIVAPRDAFVAKVIPEVMSSRFLVKALLFAEIAEIADIRAPINCVIARAFCL